MANHVQTMLAQGTGVLSVTTGAVTTTSGDLVVMGYGDLTKRFASVSDSKNNIWSQNPSSPQSVNTNSGVRQFSNTGINGGAGHTFTATASPADDLTLFVSEIAVSAAGARFDQSAGQSQTGTTTPSSGTTPTRNGNGMVLIANFSAPEVNIVSVAAGAGFTVPANGSVLNGGVSCAGGIEYGFFNPAGTDAGTFTIGASTNTGAIIGTFIELQATFIAPPRVLRAPKFKTGGLSNLLLVPRSPELVPIVTQMLLTPVTTYVPDVSAQQFRKTGGALLNYANKIKIGPPRPKIPTPLTGSVIVGGPVLVLLSPSTGVDGATVPVTLTGSGFLGLDLGVATTLTISGTLVTISNIVVVNDTTITADFIIDPAAATTARNVTVITTQGASNPLPFTVTAVVTFKAAWAEHSIVIGGGVTV